ncbi:hypothetical protein N7462_004764 [Penicillium macrosclerotiorum]|uniref:uncharacterized protein n=1 Tax=Penicillium macrosclerotiorum TaxID=303699 RepID=UPI002546FBD0|nr:uncharacterized protein N7462_004764 [Penicillium macrosclerotiorum]KAJ5690372.1 hypothetical protein N7462_004764 [Penicillium macrosclerotiorum]
MSTQDIPGRPGEDKPPGLSKYLKRMKTVLRSRSGNKRHSVAGTTPVLEGPSDTPAAAANPARKSTGADPDMLTDYSAIQQEKARVLFAKYGLTLEPGEWKSPTDLQLTRVTKPIRMRVRRTCHRCDTTFGPDKVCVNCQHPRCKKCPRFPPAHEKDEEHPKVPRARIPEIRARQPGSLPMTPHLKLTGNPAAPLAMPSRTGGQDFVLKTVRQRTRRTCHSCDTVFAPGSKECQSCKHVRCKRCPRDPPKPDKYPDGFPGDEEPPKLMLKPERTWKQPRRRVHYICHICNTSLNEGANSCAKCGQAKCAETIRIPPKKVKREPDPEVVRRVEEKIASLKIQD